MEASDMLSARRVVCPKCSTILKEPQAQIYECSVCGTLLVAKGHPVGVPSNIVLHDGIDQNAEDILKDSIKEQSHKSAHSSNKYLSEIKFSSHSAELTPPLKQKDKTLQSESTTERLLHECGHRTSDNDSVSHSESDAYLDSPLWSSDNLNTHELLEVPSLETSPTALELVNSKHVSSVSSLDCGERVQQGNQSGEKGDTLKDKNIGSEVVHMQSSPLYHHSAGTAHSKASGTMSDSLIGKETCIVDMKNAQNSVDCKQMPTTRGFRLFDLSVFGIYDKGMYDVIRKGAITELGTRDSDEAVESMVKNEPVLHCPDDVSQNVSSEAGQSGARVPETAVPREAEGTQDLSILNIENCCSRFENNRNLCEEIAERGMMSELGTRGSVEAVKSMIKNEPVLHPDDVSQNIFSEVGQSGAHVCESTAPREAGGTQDLSLINVENCGSGIEDVKSLCENIAERGMMSELGASSCDEAVQSLVENEPLLRHAGDEPQNVFSVAEQHGACVHESTELVETGDTRVLSTINLEDHCCGIGDTGNLSEESMGAAGSGLSRENLYSSNVKASGDEPLKDNDVSAETPYDNIPSIEELSVDPAHIDVSFGDWKVQLLTRPVQGVFADQKRTVATSHNRESSLNDDDDEVLAFSTSTVDSKHSGSLLINKGLQGSSHMAGSNDEPKQSILGGEPGFSVKTTFMQKVLHRDDLQSTAQQRFSHNLDERNLASDKVPNIEYPKSLFQKGTEGSVDHTMSSAYGEDLCSIPCINSDAPHTDSAEVIDERLIEPQRRNSFYNHPSSMLNLSSGRVSVTPILQKVKDKETIYMKDDGLRKKGMSMGCSNDSYIGQKIHQGDSNLATFASQKVDHVSQLNVSEKHVSQRWKGKENSSQCINIVEDLGGYRERVNAGCDQEDQPLTEGKMDKQLTDGYTFRLGQQQRDPSSRFDSLSMNFQRHPDMGLSASSMRRSSIDMQDGFHIERSRSKSEIRGQTHINRSPEHFSSHLGSNHSCQSQGLFSYEYPYNPDSFILGPSSKAPSHGAPQKASGQDHSLPLYTCGHHFVSPSWSLCTQPHCFIQHPQILPCSMVHPCAHCAIQASTVACHPLMHSEISGLDTCGLAHSKSPSNYFESGVLSAQPGRMDRSSMRKSDPVSCQRKNYYPPLPGKGAAPYVLCEECNQTLQVPEYLPSTCASVSKLRCGVCEKTCKFSLVHNHLLYNPDDGPMPAQSSPDLYFSPKGALISPNGNETRFEHEHMLKPVYDAYNGSKLSIDALRRSSMDLGRGGQRGDSQRKVVVNMSVIPEAEVQAAEVLAGPIHSGTYWYDYRAGFWGVMGGPCLGIVMPLIEEFDFPLLRGCSGGRTGILVNGRELHQKDLEILARRGLPTSSGKAYILDINGALFDERSGQPLKGLGKLAPLIERRGRGFGMSPLIGQLGI